MASMINKSELKRVKKELEVHEAKREVVIRSSRDIIKLSKQLIYAVHRKDFSSADTHAAAMNKAVAMMKRKATAKLLSQGSYKVALQEYVEALCYLEFARNKKLLPFSKIDVDFESYLLGLCDLTGELVRRAVNQGIDGKYDEVTTIHSFVSSLYDELMQFDFAGGELRKKFDSIKWDLKRLGEMVFSLKSGGKI